MYVCGMTVYDLCHLGHARVMVVFDVVYRYLRHLGYEVTYVRNITDIDDKIIRRANERGEPFADLTERFITAMHEDAAALGCPAAHRGAARHRPHRRDPGHDPDPDRQGSRLCGGQWRCLLRRRRASRATAGSPARTRRICAPGRGWRSDEAKRDPLDFALWKAAKPGEPAWDSPWGPGRPGWHIECSAMSTCCLGNHFDIHGGGADLQFPHHENEIAQSEGATGEPFVNVWMHNGFVRVNEEKMSKSLGNFFTVREILERYRPEEVRYFILTSQYRSPLNYDDEHLQQRPRRPDPLLYGPARPARRRARGRARPSGSASRAAMDDDFNTPEALAVLFDLVREINRVRPEDAAAGRGPGRRTAGPGRGARHPPGRCRGLSARRRRRGGGPERCRHRGPDRRARSPPARPSDGRRPTAPR